MKLHRIELTNLNSLYGTHVVDLDNDLHGASLFLIQGPTGAGKSTLMDAVSLALFGTTPRLGGAGSERAVAAQIMSRGTGEASAVVEFSKWEREAGARVRYRAAWTVHRSRKKADGNMQDTVRSLDRFGADGSSVLLVSDKRRKVTQPVFDKVLERFTAHDFQRSMLLAQGNFDAMLHARPEERATILERLTDTGIYQRLGERAARVRGAWKGRLEELRARIVAISPLSPEASAAAEQVEAERSGEVARLDGWLAALGAWEQWLARDQQLERDRRDAQEQRQQVGADEALARDALAALAEHERCSAAFAVHDRVVDVRGRRARQEAELGRIEAELPVLAEARDRADEAAKEALEAAQEAGTALEALRPEVRRCVEAVTAHEQAVTELQAATVRVGRQRDEVEAAEQAAAAAAQALETATAAAAEAQAAAAEVEADAELAAGLSELSEAAARIDQDAAAAARTAAALAGRRGALDQRTRALETAKVQHQQHAATALDAHSRRREQAAERLHQHTGGVEPAARAAELHQQAAALARSREAMARAGAALALAEAAETEAATRLQAAASARQAVLAAQTRHDEARAEHGAAVQRVGPAEQVLAPLQRIAELGRQRDQLGDGEACPLCGSPDHPYVDDPAHALRSEALESELAQARVQLEQRRAEVAAAQGALTGAAERLAARTATARVAEAEARDAADKRDGLRAAAIAQLQLTSLPETADSAQVETQVRQVQAEEAATEQQRTQLDTARAELDAADRALREASAALEQTGRELEERSSALAEAEAQLRRDVDAHGQATTELAAARERLGARLAVHDIRAEPAERGLASARQRANAWLAAQQALRDAASEVERRAVRHTAAQQAVEAAERVLAEAQAAKSGRVQRTEQTLGAVELMRERLISAWEEATAHDPVALPRPPHDGPATELLRSQEARHRSLLERSERAASAASDARQRLASQQARRETLDRQREALVAELDALGASLSDALASIDLADEAELSARRLEPGRVAVLTAQRTALRDRRTRAAAAVAAAGLHLDRHREVRPAPLPEEVGISGLDAADPGPADAGPGAAPAADGAVPTVEALAAATQVHRRARAVAAEALEQARTTLQMARRDAARRAEAVEDLDRAQAEARVWLTLHDLIGKADGKAFKEFAQALNLDQLLRSANVHLARLNDRYRLRPELDPDTGLPTLEFVIEDGWRPGHPRSLKTLSGGESFLVSLALALGLSDLRTSNMPVETLLLDEGFGTLDPKTLGVALAALQALQASGRQVGIISHVVGLQESIEARVLVEPLGEGRSRVRTELGGR